MLGIYSPLKYSFSKVHVMTAKLLNLGQKQNPFGKGVFSQLYSQSVFDNVFSDSSKQKFIEKIDKMKCGSKAKDAEEAAVLIPLCYVNSVPSVILTLRSPNVGKNKSDVSFPGGMRETSDKDVIQLALRETKEEIGLAATNIQIWTTLPSVSMNRRGLNITPVVAFTDHVDLKDLVIDKNEVEQVFSVTLETLCNPINQFYTEYKTGYALPVYTIGGYHLWGLTAGILHELLKLLLPHVYKHKLPRILKNLSWDSNKQY